MTDMSHLMKQAQEMQTRMQNLQEELDNTHIEGEAGGGLIKVKLTARGRFVAIDIDPSLLKPSEKTTLEDLVMAAHSDARKKADRLIESKMTAITAGIQMPKDLQVP